jgi:hypothetical protein
MIKVEPANFEHLKMAGRVWKMAKLKDDGEFTVEGTVTMWLPLEPEEGERLEVSSSQTISPLQVWVSAHPEDGQWVIGSVVVKGRLYRKDNAIGGRWSERLYSGPLDKDFEGPDWLVPLLEKEIPRRLSGRTQATEAGSGVSLTDKQVYDLNNRLHSNLGLRPTREVLEDVLGTTTAEAAPVREPVKEVSPQRSAFDSALRVLLMRENLDGTEWAIRQLREGSDAARVVAEESTELRLDKDIMWMTLGLAADELEKLLDKRTSELATKEH